MHALALYLLHDSDPIRPLVDAHAHQLDTTKVGRPSPPTSVVDNHLGRTGADGVVCVFVLGWRGGQHTLGQWSSLLIKCRERVEGEHTGSAKLQQEADVLAEVN